MRYVNVSPFFPYTVHSCFVSLCRVKKLASHLFAIEVERPQSCCKKRHQSAYLWKDSHIHCEIGFMLLVLSATPRLLSLCFSIFCLPLFSVLLLFPHFQPSNHILVSLLCAFEEEGGAAIVIRPLIIENNSRKKISQPCWIWQPPYWICTLQHNIWSDKKLWVWPMRCFCSVLHICKSLCPNSLWFTSKLMHRGFFSIHHLFRATIGKKKRNHSILFDCAAYSHSVQIVFIIYICFPKPKLYSEASWLRASWLPVPSLQNQPYGRYRADTAISTAAYKIKTVLPLQSTLINSLIYKCWSS